MLNWFQFNAQRHSRNENYQMWTHENYVVVLYSTDFVRYKLEYLHNNPVRVRDIRRAVSAIWL